MKLARLTFLLSFCLLMVACASSGPAPRTIDGAWRASLQNPDSSVAYTFIATLTQNTGSTVAVSGFLFSGSPPCFSAPTGQTATFRVTGHSSGYQTGPFGMTISAGLMTEVENVLTLNGTRNSDGTISGTWTLTGLSGCSANGAYRMQLLPML